MQYRIEHDSMGEVQVPADRYRGAQTGTNPKLACRENSCVRTDFLTGERFNEVFHPEQRI